MEVIIYLLGNWCMTGAALCVAGYLVKGKRKDPDESMLISWETVKMMLIGQVRRTVLRILLRKI